MGWIGLNVEVKTLEDQQVPVAHTRIETHLLVTELVVQLFYQAARFGGGDVTGTWNTGIGHMWLVKLNAVVASVPEMHLGELELHVYPNPSIGTLNVEIPTSGWLELQSITGQSIQLVRVNEGNFALDVSGLAAGRYQVVLHGEVKAQAAFVKE